MQTKQSCITVAATLEKQVRDYSFLDERDIVRIEVHQALMILTPRECMAVSLAYGIECYALSYAEIGRRLGVSRRCVGRLVSRALGKLRHEPNLQMLYSAIPAAWDWYGDEDSYGVAEIGVTQ